MIKSNDPRLICLERVHLEEEYGDYKQLYSSENPQSPKTMKILLDIKDNKAAFIMELLNNFKFVKAEPLSPYKEEVLKSIQKSVEEMKLIHEGKLEGIPAKELIDEL